MSRWKKTRYRIEWFGVWLLKTIIPRLPRRGAMYLAKTLGALAFYADYRGRENALENLRVVFGEEKSEKERRKIAFQSFQHFARTVIDQFWSSRLTADNVDRYAPTVFDVPEEIAEAKETGAIWVTPHYSNFEWTALVMGFRDYQFTIIAQDFKNPHLTDLFRENREVSGHQVIPQSRALLKLMKNLKRKGHAAFLTDLNIRPSKAATIIRSLGFETSVTAIHAELMRRTKLPVIPGICLPQDDGTYIIRGFPALKFDEDASDQEIAQTCWDAFEAIIREHPAPWLWMYKHWRYRPSEDGERYPSYASPNKAFDKLRAELLRESPAHD